jgi:hypothetical protein
VGGGRVELSKGRKGEVAKSKRMGGEQKLVLANRVCGSIVVGVLYEGKE